MGRVDSDGRPSEPSPPDRRARDEGKDAVPASTSGERIRGFQTQSATTIHGKSSVFFGLPFLGTGIFLTLVGTGVISVDKSSINGPPWLIALFGAIFGLPGAWLILHGIRGAINVRRIARERDRHSREPWRYDYRWSETGIRDMQARGVRQMLFGMLFIALFAAPFNWLAFASESAAAVGYVFACVNSIVAIYAFAFAYRMARWMKFGTGRLQFRRFPFFLGEKLQVDFVPGRRLDGIGRVVCTLRCIREEYETTRVNNRQHVEIVGHELFRDVREVDAETAMGALDRSIPISFDLPNGSAVTRLSDRPPTYWELDISAATRGVDLNSRFLLPVYSREAGPETTATA